MVVAKDTRECEATGMGSPWWISPLAVQGWLHGKPLEHDHHSLAMYLSSVSSPPFSCILSIPVPRGGEELSTLLHHHPVLTCHSPP